MSEIVNNLSVILPAIILVGFASIIALFCKKDSAARTLLMIIPTIVSIVTFIGSLYGSVNEDLNIVNLGVAIIGVAVTVWLSVNIYNIIEKKNFDDYKEQFEERTKKTLIELESTKDEVEKQIQDIKNVLLKETLETKRKFQKLQYNEFEVGISNIEGSKDIFQLSTDIKNEIFNFLGNKFFIIINIESISANAMCLGVKSTEEVNNNIVVIDLKEAITNRLKELEVTGDVHYFLCLGPIEMNF